MKFATLLCLFVASLTVSGLPIEDRDTSSLAIRAKKAPVKSKPSASSGKPVAAKKPAVVKPAAAKPVAAKPGPVKPVAAKPAAVKPAAQIAPSAAQAESAQNVFAAMRNHIFNGEKSNPSSGRHTSSSWTSANKDAGRCDTESKLCVFKLNNTPPKTVFDDRAGGFTQSDIQQMCTTAITLNLKSATATGKLENGAFVVQTKFGRPICVEHLVADPGSCFPLGIHPVRGAKLNELCGSSGNNEIKGKTTEIAARP
ncbi:hypothetical protein DFH06DRAFT_1315538 [Mycena polygramma]|nr:hypothetical protein DFH06DRAFT_1315538 [Mycena polygramma]